MQTDIFGYCYAATVAAGGLLGYVKAGSLSSIGTGVIFGAILVYGAYLNSLLLPQPRLQLWTTAVLAVLTADRWAKSKDIMPAGLVCLISFAFLWAIW